jgi:hypothetical protein
VFESCCKVGRSRAVELENVVVEERSAWAMLLSYETREEIAKLCLSASEPAIHKEVRNCSSTFSYSVEE